MGWIRTDRSPISSAPTVEPGVRVYLPSVPEAGVTVTILPSSSRSAGVSGKGPLVSYSRRSISRIARAGLWGLLVAALFVTALGVRRGRAGGLAPEPAELELVETVMLAG